MKKENIEGKVFSRLTVVKRVGTNKHGQATVECKCSCGEIKTTVLQYIKRGSVQSCGCLFKETRSTCAINHIPSNTVERVGHLYGKLTVTSRATPLSNKWGDAMWDCSCSCGNEVKNIRGKSLSNGDKKSCGCGTRDDGFKKYQYQKYMESAKKRNYEFILTLDEFALLIQSSCYYCGIEPYRDVSVKRTGKFLVNGIDRIDNTLGYSKENCVACCTTCNSAKGSLSQSEFIEWAHRLSTNLHSKEI